MPASFLARFAHATRMNGYNFTERVRSILARSREEAGRLRHEYVGTEHILLAILHDDGGVALAALDELGVDRARVAAMIEQTVRPGNAAPSHTPELPYTSRAKKALELAMSAARDLHHAYVGAEHLLLGLIDEEQGIAAQVLVACGAHRDAVGATIVRLLGAPAPGARPAAPSPADHALEALAWARLTHALELTTRLGATPSLEVADDGALLASLGPDLVVRVEMPPHVVVRRRGEPR